MHTNPFHCGNTIDPWGFLSERLTVPKRRSRMLVTPNTAMGTGTGWNRHRGGRVTARTPKESRPWRRPGEVFGEDCSQVDPERGRRVGRRHEGVKVRGAGPDREARTGSNGQDTTGPDTDRVRHRRRADGATGRKPGTEYRGPPAGPVPSGIGTAERWA